MILHHNPRLLYYILVRKILSKPNSTDSLNNRTLELIYLLMADKPVNFARYIIGYAAKVSSIIRPAPLPYSNLLTLIFKHFGVFLEHDICETKSVTVITPLSLKNIQLFKTDSGVWKFIEDMTLDEEKSITLCFAKHVKPRHTSPSSVPPHSLLDHVVHLDEQVYELQESTDRLDYILV